MKYTTNGTFFLITGTVLDKKKFGPVLDQKMLDHVISIFGFFFLNDKL